MKSLFLAAIVVGACAATPDAGVKYRNPCFTRCGLMSWDIDCRELQEVETRAIKAYATHTVWKAPQICDALVGWDVRVHASYTDVDRRMCRDGAWYSPSMSACLGGYTHIATRSVEIGDGDLLTGSLVHELGHVIDIALTPHIGHCLWIKRGLRKAISSVTGGGLDRFASDQEHGDCPSPDGGGF